MFANVMILSVKHFATAKKDYSYEFSLLDVVELYARSECISFRDGPKV